MKNHEALVDLRAKATFYIEKAFDRGYDQGYQDGKEEREKEYKEALHNIENTYIKGQKAEYDRGYKEGKEAVEDDMWKYYNKHFNDVVHSSNDDAYQRGYKDGMQNPSSIGYQHGYEAGLQHGKELRVKEADCAYQCGMRKAWDTAWKIGQQSYTSLTHMGFENLNSNMNASFDCIKKYSAYEAVAKLEAWEKKQEQTEKNCDNCKYNNREKTSYPCAACLRKIDGRHAMWEEKEDYVRDATPEESKSVNDYTKSISEETGVTFNVKEEHTEKSCKTYKSNPPEKKWPCVDCDVSIHDRYEPSKESVEE